MELVPSSIDQCLMMTSYIHANNDDIFKEQEIVNMSGSSETTTTRSSQRERFARFIEISEEELANIVSEKDSKKTKTVIKTVVVFWRTICYWDNSKMLLNTMQTNSACWRSLL